MTMTALSEIARLSVSERIQLAEDIWDSISSEQIPLPEAQRAELDRRLQDHRADPQAGAAWSEVNRRIQGQG